MDRLQAMEMFVRVVETGSFSRAAKEFATTQPTVTKQVAATEARLKVRLLNRNTRGVSLTEAGALYYEKCKIIVREAEEAENVVRLRQSQAQGLLRVGSSVAFGRRVVVPLALEFMRQHPQLQVDLSFWTATPTWWRRASTSRSGSASWPTPPSARASSAPTPG